MNKTGRRRALSRAGRALLLILFLILAPLAAQSQVDESGFPVQIGDFGSDQGLAVVADSQRNVYVAGVFQGTLNFETTTLTSEGQNDIFVAKYDPNAELLWARSAGSTGNDAAWDMALDQMNNIYVAGEFSDTLRFIDEDLDEDESETTLTSAGSTDIFVAKYNSSGVLQWATRAGGSRQDAARAIAIDPMGIGVITGSIRSSAQFDNFRILADTDVSSPYVATFTPNGRFIWVNHMQSTGNAVGASIGADNSRHIYVMGEYFGEIDFDDEENAITLTSEGSNDIFLARFHPDSDLVWAESAGGEGDDAAGDIFVEPIAGDFYITGSIGDTADFDGTELTHVGERDVYVAHYSADGAIQWGVTEGSGGTEVGASISWVENEALIVTGRFERTWTVDNTVLGSEGSTDIFIFRYDLDGELIWARTAGGPGNDAPRAVYADENGVALITGFFSDTAEFDGVKRTSNGGLDAFLVRYDMFGFLVP